MYGKEISDLRRSLIEPDTDFVTMAQPVDCTAKTVTISEEELNQIREGSRSMRMDQDKSPEIGRQVIPPAEKKHEQLVSSQKRQEPEESRTQKSGRNEDVNPQTEKLLTGLGISVAVLFVAGLSLVMVKISGIFNRGSGETEQSQRNLWKR